MKTKDLKSINNLCLRYQDYDNSGIKYAYDIRYTTIHSDGESVKAKRQRGSDSFCNHIKELTENYDGVATIIVADYSGTSQNARMINPPVTIELIDVQKIGLTPKVIIQQGVQVQGQCTNPVSDMFQGLNGLFAGTEFEGLGNLAPIAKFLDDKHTIERLREKNEAKNLRITELERINAELSGQYQALTAKYDDLQDEADDMDDELTGYRNRARKQNDVMNVIGLAGASMAKNFLRQNPGILSGILPAEQLSGILSDEADDQTEDFHTSKLPDEEQGQLDRATSAFEWLQTLDKQEFEEVFDILCIIRQQPDLAAHILQSLKEA